MKNVRNDSKYIIKRILIGVGIAIILFNLKKCNVYADTGVRTFYNTANNLGDGYWKYSTETGNCAAHNYNNSNDTFNYDGYEYNVCWYAPNNPGKKQLIAFEYNDDVYVIYGNLNALSSSNNYINIVADNTQFRPTILNFNDNSTIQWTEGYIPSYANFNWSTHTTTYYNLTKISVDTDITHNNVVQLDPSFIYQHLNDFRVIYSTNNLPVYINTVLAPTVDNPLANYTEVDITGKEAILIVPKNYLQLSNTDYYYNETTSEHFIDLKYGYQRCIRSTTIDITDVSQFFTKDSWVDAFADNPYETAEQCADEPTLTYSRFLYTSPSLQNTDKPYNYLSLLLYNNSVDYSSTSSNDWVNNQHNPYGANSVWVNTSLYNYYLIDNLKNFNQTITFKNSDGDDQSVYIETLPTFDEMITSSLDLWDDNSNATDTSRIETFISFVKLPFSFLKSLTTDACSPITLPLPRMNASITLPCIRATISSVLGSQLVAVIQVIINGLIVYRFTIGNIWSLQEALDPVEDKLEVLDL